MNPWWRPALSGLRIREGADLQDKTWKEWEARCARTIRKADKSLTFGEPSGAAFVDYRAATVGRCNHPGDWAL